MNFINDIIPYQELLGNYDNLAMMQSADIIIPYQELLGNYDVVSARDCNRTIIPYQELLGNYDTFTLTVLPLPDYTIPRAIREL